MNLILPHLTIVICSNLSSRTGGNSRGAFVGVSKFTRASGDETKSQCNKSTFLNRAPLACAQANLFFWPHLSAAKMPGLLAPACPCPISSRFVDSDGEVIFEIFLNLDLAF